MTLLMDYSLSVDQKHDSPMTLALHDVAQRLGVRLRLTDECSACKDGRSANLSLRRRTVRYSTASLPEHILHEMVHVALTPPKRMTGYPQEIALDSMPEDLFLLQYERCVARMLSREIYDRVVDWQGETETWFIGPPRERLCDTLGYERTDGWRSGFGFARALGILDHRNRPTWNRPHWTRRLGLLAQEAIAYARLSPGAP